jgi:anti-sigma B factor antagonist
MDFSLDVRNVDGVAVFDLKGRLCLDGSLLILRNAVKQSLGEGTNRLVVNLTGITFIDSSGLGELITTHTSVHNAGGAMNLLNPSKRIKELLQMTRLLNVFKSFDDETLSVGELKR